MGDGKRGKAFVEAGRHQDSLGLIVGRRRKEGEEGGGGPEAEQGRDE